MIKTEFSPHQQVHLAEMEGKTIREEPIRPGCSAKARAVLTRIGDCARKTLTFRNLLRTAKHAIEAKIYPLCNPPGWEKKKEDIFAKIRHFKSIQKSCLKQIDEVEKSMKREVRKGKRDSKVCEMLNQRHTDLKNQLTRANTAINDQQQLLEHLDNERKIEYVNRLVGYTGMLGVGPVAGKLLGLGVKIGGMIAKEQSASELPNIELANRTANAVRQSNLLNMMSTTATLGAQQISSAILNPH